MSQSQKTTSGSVTGSPLLSQESWEISPSSSYASGSGVSQDFDLRFSGEALDALEESLKQQMDVILADQKQFDDMYRRLTARNEEIISKVIEETDALKEETDEVNAETKQVILERDQTMLDLRNVEQAFTDVHRKYERSIAILNGLKTNEEVMLERDQELQLAISLRDQKLEAFKDEAHHQTEKLYQDSVAKVASMDAEHSRLTALHRRSEMRVETLGSELDHKLKENAQLNSLADELIAKK